MYTKRLLKFGVMPIVVLIVLVTNVLAGCGPRQDAAGKDTSVSPSPAATVTPDASPDSSEETDEFTDMLPIKGEPVKLTLFGSLQGTNVQFISTYDDTATLQEIMKRTGLTLEYICPAAGQEVQTFNLMISSEDLPDIVVGFFYKDYKGGVTQAIEDGLIIDEGPLVEKYAPNFNKIVDDQPMLKKVVYANDGTLTGYGAQFSFDQSFEDQLPYNGPFIRQDFLDKVGLPMPETIDDWYTVLKAFKEELNVPAPLSVAGPYGFSAGFLTSAYDVVRYSSGTKGYFNDNGVAKFSHTQPQFKDYLSTLNKWYEEELIDKDFPTKTYYDHVLPMLQSGTSASAVVHLLSIKPVLEEIEAGGGSLVPAPLPVLTKGQKLRERDSWGYFVDLVTAKYITTKCKTPEIAIQYVDWLYSPEAKKLTNWGIEGESYTMVDGKEEFTDAYKDDMARMGTMYTPNLLKQEYDMRMNLMQYNEKFQLDAMDMWSRQASLDMKFNPAFILTPEESDIVNTKMMDISTYCEEMYLKFIMGLEPLDKFDEYVAQMEAMGIDEVTKQMQAALDRSLE